MEFLKISKAQFQLSVGRMIDENFVYGVKAKSPSYEFDRLFTADELCLNYNITLLSPNKYFLPPRTPLMGFKLDGKISVDSMVGAQPGIIIGIHPYDLHALKLLDAVFLGNLKDAYYQARRQVIAIIGIDCLQPWQYSFAASMGTAFPPAGFDLWLTDTGDKYLIEVGSEKGEELCRKYLDASEAGEIEVKQREKLREESLSRYKLSLDISPQLIPEVLNSGWNSSMWEELGEKCFSCGSCTMVCPTCVCFDVRDTTELNRLSGERYRIWDSCMFDAFATIASGENFRPTGTDRLRHRLYRKGKYMLQRWGRLGCVGCGRCIHACLVDIASPVYAYNRLAREARTG
ncbi:MAG: 4Fe-4S dicluster domain-containing protein [Deltaproteobacteria bacterium]|nr:4Fe-4S dicluster domain-containing protein [Deltaproteobacteria bacterium]